MNQLAKPTYRWPDLSYYPWLNNLVEEIHTNTGIDKRMILIAILSVIACVLQVPYRAKRPGKRPMPLSLLIWIIAGSGTGKSELFDLLTKPMARHQKRNISKFMEKLNRHLGKIRIWNVEMKILEKELRKAIESGMCTTEIREKIEQHQLHKPEPPRRPTMMHNDSSVYAMIQDVMQNHVSLFMASSDAINMLNKNEFMKLVPILLERFSGMEYNRGRKNEGTADLSRTFITLLMMLQENILMGKWKDIGEECREVGLWARTMFNLVLADDRSTHTPPEDPDWTHLMAFEKQVEHFLNLTDQFLDDPDKQPTVFEYSPEAGEYNGMLLHWVDSHKKEGGAFSNMTDIANRMAEISGRIATNLHIFSLNENPVDLGAIKTGIDIYMAFLPDLVKIVDCEATHIRNAKKLHHWLVYRWMDKERRYISWAKLLRSVPPVLRDADMLKEALSVLIHQDKVSMFKCGGADCLELEPSKYFDYARATDELSVHSLQNGKIIPPLRTWKPSPFNCIEAVNDHIQQETMPIPYMSIAPLLPKEWPEELTDITDDDQTPSGREFDHFIKYLQ